MARIAHFLFNILIKFKVIVNIRKSVVVADGDSDADEMGVVDVNCGVVVAVEGTNGDVVAGVGDDGVVIVVGCGWIRCC